MAEGTSTSLDDAVGLFDLSLFEDGDTSQLSHDSTRRIPESTICRFFLRGRCKFGDNCWNSHTQVKNDASSKFNQRCDRNSAGPSRQCSENREICPPKLDIHKKESYEPKYSFLHKKTAQNEEFKKNLSGQHPPNWVNAPEFVPKTIRSYADTLKCNINYMNEPPKMPSMELCSYFVDGDCPFEDQCPYIHGDICELCGKACLNPYDDQQRQMHTDFCEKELEQDMELSFAIQRSLDKSCGICMDVIMEKEPISERRFGILEKCNHVFCLSCIRKWRKVKSFESNNHIDSVLDPVVTRACPECRVSSDFITPSQYWVDTEDEKQKLISEYKIALSKKPCKYFKQGKGTCPFGGACFYLHAKPDGTKVELPPPVRRRRQNQDGELDFMGRIFLWDYLELRDNDILMQLELEDFMFAISDTDDDTSEASDNFFLSRSLSAPRQYAPKPNFPSLIRFSSSDSAAYTATYDFETLTVTAPDDHILHVELNRPECYNAMNKMFWREMLDCFRKIRDDRYCRAVIISGSGQLFSAGLDYSDMQDITSQVAGKGDVARKAKFLLSLIAKYQESFNAVENCQKPVIAAIHGKCSGGGVDLVCACDIRYASQDAFFEIEQVDVGMAADLGTLQRLPKIVGNDSLIREYAYSCAKIDPEEAKHIGLVGRVFPTKEAMMTAALGLAKVIASKSPVAIQGTKVALNFSRDHSVQDGLQFMTYWNMTMLQSEDVLKAAEATINKSDKPPRYSKL